MNPAPPPPYTFPFIPHPGRSSSLRPTRCEVPPALGEGHSGQVHCWSPLEGAGGCGGLRSNAAAGPHAVPRRLCGCVSGGGLGHSRALVRGSRGGGGTWPRGVRQGHHVERAPGQGGSKTLLSPPTHTLHMLQCFQQDIGYRQGGPHSRCSPLPPPPPHPCALLLSAPSTR